MNAPVMGCFDNYVQYGKLDKHLNLCRILIKQQINKSYS